MKYKFLIIRLSSIGDIVLSTPLIRCLKNKYPDSQIDFLVKKEFSDVLVNNPNINQLILFDKNNGKRELKDIKQLLRQNNYTHIIDIQLNIRSIYLSRGLGAVVSGFSKRLFARFCLIKLHLNIYRTNKPVYLRYFEALHHLGVEYDQGGTSLYPSEEHYRKVDSWLIERHIAEKTFLVIAPGAKWANKRWLPKGFAETADLLRNNGLGHTLLVGGADDQTTCNQIQQLMQTESVNSAGLFSLLESAALISRAKLLITNDTGLMHIAQAMETPVVSIFGPTTKELGFFPLPDKSRVAEADVACRPCTQKGLDTCPKRHFNCMNNITSSLVVNLAKELLQDSDTV